MLSASPCQMCPDHWVRRGEASCPQPALCSPEAVSPADLSLSLQIQHQPLLPTGPVAAGQDQGPCQPFPWCVFSLPLAVDMYIISNLSKNNSDKSLVPRGRSLSAGRCCPEAPDLSPSWRDVPFAIAHLVFLWAGRLGKQPCRSLAEVMGTCRGLAGTVGEGPHSWGVCHECTCSMGTAHRPGEHAMGGCPRTLAMKSHTAELWVVWSVQAQGLPTFGAAEVVPSISLPRTSVLHLAEEASQGMQIGRLEVCKLLSTPLTQAEYYKSLILLLAYLWTLSWWSMFPNLEQSQLLLVIAEVPRTIASHPSHMMGFPL